MTNLSQNDLKSLAVQSAEKISAARTGVEYFDEPFKHIVIDNFLPGSLAEDAFQDFPPLDSDI